MADDGTGDTGIDELAAPPPPLKSLQRLITDPAQQEEMAARQDKDKENGDKKDDEKDNDINVPAKFGNTKEGQAAQYVIDNSTKGDTNSILKAFESYVQQKGFLMHIGEERGQILDENILKHKPKSILELGVYLGYSTVRIANIINKYDNKDEINVQFISIEKEKEFVTIANEMCKHGNVNNRTNILHGTIQDVKDKIINELKIKQFDFIFMDHVPKNYLDDLLFLEKCGFIGKNSVIVADNIGNGWSDTQKFQNHVRQSGKYKSQHFRDKDNADGIEVAVCLK